MSDKETIMLSKQYNPKKLEFPVMVSEKLDGVAADFYGFETLSGTRCAVRSRQDKPIPSVEHIRSFLTGVLGGGYHIVCELYNPTMSFKDISGSVRRQDEIAFDIKAYIYDFYVEGVEELTYASRMNMAHEHLDRWINEDSPVQFIPQDWVKTQADLDQYIVDFSIAKPEAEGLVIRNAYGKDSGYKFGRSWGMQKLKPKGDVDLEVVSFEEAISAEGNPLGMVGRLNVRYKDNIIGAGAGALTHPERTHIWQNQDQYIGKIAEIHYMIDPAYEALREARFFRWRDDKSTPNEE